MSPVSGPDRGAAVTVTMARNNVFPWQRGPTFTATYIHGPQGAGDVFAFEVDGRHIQINGNSADFVAITFIPEENEVPF